VIPFYVGKPLQFEPGSKWQYCQSGIISLGRIVEIVSGESFPAFLQKRLFDPLGMKDTTFYLSSEQFSRLAMTYRRTQAKLEEEPLDFLQTQSLGAALKERAVNAVAVAQQVLRGRHKREGFPKLLSRPSRGRGRYDIEVQNAAAMMRQDNKDVQEVKVEGGDDEEVDRHHAAEVIVEENRPVLGWGPADTRDHVLGDGALGNGQAKLKEFTVDAGSPPRADWRDSFGGSGGWCLGRGSSGRICEDRFSIARRAENPRDATEGPCWVEPSTADSSTRPRLAKARPKGPGPAASDGIA
jgi:CubicO group peptidase (beta-lactamase class C family)